MGKKIAIIDIGSNTIRLVIYDIKAGNFIKEIENIKVSARLHNYLDYDHYLNTEGVNTLLEALNVFKEIIELHKVSSIKVVATAAIRQAKNQEQIKQEISEKIGLTIEILSGEQEAHYGFLGIISATDKKDGITVDLGGGSLEITKFLDGKLIKSHSFPFGVLSLTQQFIRNKVPTISEIASLSYFLQSSFEGIDWLKNCQLSIIAIGGSARSLGEVDQAMKNYPINSIHLYEMNDDDIINVREKLNSLSFDEIQNVLGLSKERSDIIFPAIEVFLSIYRTVNAPLFQISEKGLRDGILFDHIKINPLEMRNSDLLEKRLRQIALEYDIDLEKREMVSRTAILLFESIHKAGISDINDEDWHDLRRASYFYNLGEIFQQDAALAHTFYILSNRNIFELPHREWIKIAIIASFQSKATFKQNVHPFKNWFTKDDRKKLRLLGAILKLSFVLNTTKRGIVQDIDCKEEKNLIQLKIVCSKNWIIEKQEAQKQVKHLESSLDKSIRLLFVSVE